ncbi:MAG: hypothetical protein MUF49_11245 [Oculatellaceae cyanobacterium Prado106]|jgi:peptidoglycan hydrolase-like protein with peptidoglycan-binding domain|nr:hypothetical protein [Oculatellaceae cyanobacterium Prado106]
MSTVNLQAIAQEKTVYSIPTIRQNRDLVSSLQSSLNVMGFSAGTVDGIWDGDTEAAYKTFAKQYGFKADELSPKAARFILSSSGANVRPSPSPSPNPSPNNNGGSRKPEVTPQPSPSNHKGDVLKEALEFSLKWEGGFVDHPNDLGGATNKGITTATYNEYLWRKGRPRQSVRNITDAEVNEIYRDLFWMPSQADRMIRALAIVHFDTAVNFGVGGSVMFLQEVLNLGVDGVFGAKTRAALEKANTLQTAKRYCQARIDYRHQRVRENSSQKVFLQGWLNRDNDLMSYISNLR